MLLTTEWAFVSLWKKKPSSHCQKLQWEFFLYFPSSLAVRKHVIENFHFIKKKNADQKGLNKVCALIVESNLCSLTRCIKMFWQQYCNLHTTVLGYILQSCMSWQCFQLVGVKQFVTVATDILVPVACMSKHSSPMTPQRRAHSSCQDQFLFWSVVPFCLFRITCFYANWRHDMWRDLYWYGLKKSAV